MYKEGERVKVEKWRNNFYKQPRPWWGCHVTYVRL